VRHRTISLRRRHMLIASLAGIAVPSTVFAGQCSVASGDTGSMTELATSIGENRLIISGRILWSDCAPLAGATVEMWHVGTGTNRTSTTTDADGRFFAEMAPARLDSARPIHYRVSHDTHGTSVRQLYLARARGAAGDSVSHLQRDDTGAWRTTFGVTLA
jgi:protocatechuate 3,4-dioxygenase beta subunit